MKVSMKGFFTSPIAASCTRRSRAYRPSTKLVQRRHFHLRMFRVRAFHQREGRRSAYGTYLERWDLPVLAGFEVFVAGRRRLPAEKMQFAGSKRMVLVYNDRPGESKAEIPEQ